MNLLGVNRLMGLSNSLSTNNDKRATKKSLQVQRKSSRGLTVPFILKRSLTSQVMSLPINLPWLLISIGWKRWWYGCSQKWAWEWGWIWRLGWELWGYLWGWWRGGNMMFVVVLVGTFIINPFQPLILLSRITYCSKTFTILFSVPCSICYDMVWLAMMCFQLVLTDIIPMPFNCHYYIFV